MRGVYVFRNFFLIALGLWTYVLCMYVYGSLYQFMGGSYMPEKPPNIQVLCTLSGDVMMYMKCFCENPVLNASGIMSIERRCYAIADIKKSR